MSGIIDYEIKRRNRYRWWVNPTDPASLRLTAEGLKFVKTVLKFESFEFELPEDLTNHHLLQLERVFGGMYFLLKRKKIIVFDEAEAVMLTLHGSNLRNYLESLDATNG
ncbi:MAG TPA: hypothetical protein VFM18_18780 [Methanosarcina sp.]|nr:hypothetical protein [Methanosarcina sp.]